MKKGAIVAAMAAGLFTAALPAASRAADTDKVHCYGINECKGQGACKGAGSCSGKNSCKSVGSCAGTNSCKGKGWIETSEKECRAKGGRVEKMKAKK